MISMTIITKAETATGESRTEIYSHSKLRRFCSTTMMLLLVWQTQHFIRMVSLPVDLMYSHFLSILHFDEELLVIFPNFAYVLNAIRP